MLPSSGSRPPRQLPRAGPRPAAAIRALDIAWAQGSHERLPGCRGTGTACTWWASAMVCWSDLSDASRIARVSASRRSRVFSARLPFVAWSAGQRDPHRLSDLDVPGLHQRPGGLAAGLRPRADLPRRGEPGRPGLRRLHPVVDRVLPAGLVEGLLHCGRGQRLPRGRIHPVAAG